jgi:hypothetical protein
MRSVSFEHPSPRSCDFYVSISPDTYLKMKINHQKLVLCDDTIVRYNLTNHTVWSFISSNKDKIDLPRLLATVKSN